MWADELRVDSVAVHAGRDDLGDLGVHALPIDLSTTNPLPDIERGGASYEVIASGGEPPADGSAVYARLWNPTVARFDVRQRVRRRQVDRQGVHAKAGKVVPAGMNRYRVEQELISPHSSKMT